MKGVSEKDFLRYWGKTNKSVNVSGASYHLLAYHCLDVAACGHCMVQQNTFGIKDKLEECGIKDTQQAGWISWLFASHDVGKFARSFQRYALFPDSPLVPPLPGATLTERHDSLGYYVLTELLKEWCNDDNDIIPDIPFDERNDFRDALNTWVLISTGHHGIPPQKGIKSVLAFDDEDIIAASHFLTFLNSLFSFSLPEIWKTKQGKKTLKQNSWFFAGVMTLADWMGSDETHFPLISEPMPLEDYWILACEKAHKAHSRMPVPSAGNQYTGHQTLFPFIQTLTPLQERAATLDISSPGPQLFILEDVTGAGKTEAALILTHRLMSANKGTGLYVGLPTMATANAMYARLSVAYRALFAEEARPSLILAHGGRQMSASFRQSIWQPHSEMAEDYARNDPNATVECHAWFADSRKKALLAEVGVGTLDQLLMAVMPFRHQSLRLLGMRNKILLLDEVHAYDGYMVKLLEGLLRFHASQGGSAIILSATIPASLREKLLNAFNEGAGLPVITPSDNANYPWLSHLSSSGLVEQPLETRKEVCREVAINWIHQRNDALTIIYDVIEAGGCVCWIRNTVDDALSIFQQLLKDGKIPADDMLLFHSRFAFIDRMTIEEKTLNWFGKEAPVAARRGKVLIATQVVEQSLDLDFDCMISDLAPVDLLIQRAGRLQRHIRDAQGNCKRELPDERPSPVLHILAPEWQPDAQKAWLGEELRGTGYVYPDHGCLWRTQALLHQLGVIRMPEDARKLVDGVYEQMITAPPTLQTVSDLAFGKVLSQRSIAGQNLLRCDKGYDRNASDFMWDQEREFSTRLGEEGFDLYLAWLDDEGQLQPITNEDDFRWEKSRLSVRASWWAKYSGSLNCPNEDILEQFRTKQHRPAARVVLVSPDGEAPFYSKRFGLTGQI